MRKRLLKMPPLGAAAAVTVLAFATAVLAAADPSDVCEGSKLSLVAKYGSCRLKAESKVAKVGGVVGTGDYTKCSLDKFATAETKATNASDTCPTMIDQSTVTTYMNDCTARVATWLNGGGGLPDTCAADLATCESDLADCEAQPDGQVLKTGQTTTYGAGSDGALQKGIARSFTDNGDGTITDNTTGLMWEKKSDDGTIHDMDDAYTWGITSPPYTMNGTMVTAFLANLNGGGGFAGYTDWRIPNVQELESLRNFEAVNPATHSQFNSGCVGGCTVTTCSCTQSSNYWSSTTYQFSPDYAWIVYFFGGDTFANNKTNGNYVRAVRAGS